MTNFSTYQQSLLSYINNLKEDGEDALEFLNNLQFVEGEYYGAYSCDICGHSLKYAMVLKSFYIERIIITAAPDNDVFIGTTCFKKLTSLAWLEKNLHDKYEEWQKAIKALRSGDKETYKGIAMSVTETKQRLEDIRQKEREAKEKSFFEERKARHQKLLAENTYYKYIFEKYGYQSKDMVDDEARRFHSLPFANLNENDLNNDFLCDLFKNIQNVKGLTEKQNYWFEKLIKEDMEKDTPEYKAKLLELKVIEDKLLSLVQCQLSAFDEDFIHSLHSQVHLGRMLSEKQQKALEKFLYKYRVQLSEKKNCAWCKKKWEDIDKYNQEGIWTCPDCGREIEWGT